MNELVLALFQTVQKLARSGFDFPQTLSFGVRVVICPDIEYVNKNIQPVGSASIILGKKRRFMVDTLQHAFILVRTTGRIGPCDVLSNVGKDARAGLVTIMSPTFSNLVSTDGSTLRRFPIPILFRVTPTPKKILSPDKAVLRPVPSPAAIIRTLAL